MKALRSNACLAVKIASICCDSHGRLQEGEMGSPDPLDFDINFSHIITVAPGVEIQMHFWKGAKFAGSVGHPMTKMLSASGALRPPDPLTRGSAP